jgi:hypothetical protein
VATVSPGASSLLPKAGGSGTFILTATPGDCAWTAVADASASWVTSVTPASGTGTATVTFTAGANAGRSTRTGKVNVGYSASGRTMKKIFTVRQSGR